jgi:hypothetical protein
MAVSFRGIRITILLIILAMVSLSTWLGIARTTDWDHPLWVVVYPMNGDGTPESQAIIRRLDADAFDAVTDFMKREAARYGVALDRPVVIDLAPEVMTPPPPTPRHDANPLSIAWWSLKIRYWSWKVDSYRGPEPDIRLYVEYYKSGENGVLDTSFGLQKSRISVIRQFTSRRMAQKNLVIVVHELLHTIGATDKYDLATLHVAYPEGYAEPARSPLYPQRKAEIMGGRIPVTARKFVMPASLEQCIVGPETAREIGWLDRG